MRTIERERKREREKERERKRERERGGAREEETERQRETGREKEINQNGGREVHPRDALRGDVKVVLLDLELLEVRQFSDFDLVEG